MVQMKAIDEASRKCTKCIRAFR